VAFPCGFPGEDFSIQHYQIIIFKEVLFMEPTHDDLQRAFQAGFDSIDEGDTFYTGFHSYLGSLGFRHLEDNDCTCQDSGYHGHMPECRWVKN